MIGKRQVQDELPLDVLLGPCGHTRGLLCRRPAHQCIRVLRISDDRVGQAPWRFIANGYWLLPARALEPGRRRGGLVQTAFADVALPCPSAKRLRMDGAPDMDGLSSIGLDSSNAAMRSGCMEMACGHGCGRWVDV